MSLFSWRPVTTAAVAVLVVTGAAVVTPRVDAFAATTPAAHPGHDRVVSPVPASWTPQIKDGKVKVIAQAGNTMVVGGDFTSVSTASGAGRVSRQNVVAFNATSGALYAGFNPSVNGEVTALAPGPTSNTVYVGGSFSSVNGIAGKLFLLDVNTGQRVSTFRPPGINGAVQDVVMVGNRLFVGGSFSSVGNTAHAGLVTLNSTTGSLDPFMNVQLTEHHNYTGKSGQAVGALGVRALDISPDGRWLAAVGNFKKADGLARDQLVMADLSGTTAKVRPDWRTRRFEPRCFDWAFDYYVRDITFAPDGSYFAVAATGGPNPGTLCDTATRWATMASGDAVEPEWIDDSGGDTDFSIAASGAAVYTGGHQRWQNNAGGRDSAAPGSVPRPGMAGFDPRSGVPLSWNPGRQPRGIGAEALLVTSSGLWVGSDTDYIGNMEYWRPRLAFFPVAGGKQYGPGAVPILPANLYRGGPGGASSLDRTWYDGSTPPKAPTGAPTGNIDWSRVRGAVSIDGELFYNTADGAFHRRTFDGTAYGPDALIDPYNDPKWSNVQTGSGQTYRGVRPSYYSEIGSIRGLAYQGGKLFYTKSGSSALFYRLFSPESGIVTQQTWTVPGFSAAAITGVFFSGDSLYFTNGLTGVLSRIDWVDGAPRGTAQVVSGPAVDGRDWRANALFPGPGQSGSGGNQPPSAVVAVPACAQLQCSFDASASSDPDGAVISYAWDFGDGASASGPTPAHTYGTEGTYTVKVTVTDNGGATGVATRSVTVQAAPSAGAAQFIAAAKSTATTTRATVNVPAEAREGDTLLLFVTTNSLTQTSAPGGAGTWIAEQRRESASMATALYSKSAVVSDAGRTITVSSPSYQKVDLQLLAYRGAAAVQLRNVVSTADAATAAHKTPLVGVTGPDQLALSFWADKSSATTDWTPPSTVRVRSEQIGTGGGRLASLIGDAVVATGTDSYGGITAVTDRVSSRGVMFTVILDPAG